MVERYIKYYETYKTQTDAQQLCQCLLDLDLVDRYPQYKTLCNYLMLEGCLYDVGAWDEYMKLES